MIADIRTLVVINLAIQLVLIVVVSGAAYLAKRRRYFRKHCIVLRIAVPLQIIAIVSVMLPSMLSYIERGQRGFFFNIEMLTHHTLGIAVVALWIYINLVFMGIITGWGRLVVAMRLAFVFWVLALLLGLHTYVLVWM